MMTPKCIFVMGVCGCGKTTIGELLASELGACFEDGDKYHSTRNKTKMSKGIPLTDEDRSPWLLQLSQMAVNSIGPIVIACSALKKKYRKLLTNTLGDNYVFIHLEVNRRQLEQRLSTRKGHFVDCKLLDSQLATLEIPFGEKNCLIIDANQNVQETVQNALQALKSLNL